MVRLYKSTTGVIHIVLAGYICNLETGKVKPNMQGDKLDVTCKNCIMRFNQW